jgi:hypothetical protein
MCCPPSCTSTCSATHYLRNNAHTLVNYGARYCKGLPISSSIAESAVNQLVSHRMAKKRQMRWTDEGAHCVAQIRVVILNGELSGESASQKLSGAANCFDWLLSSPERTTLFNATMTAFSTLHMIGVLEAYDFSSAAEIVDVGGGHGRITAGVLKRNPGMHGILFDLPHALAGGQSTMYVTQR